MEFLSIIKKIRIISKKSKTFRKLIEFVPILRSLDQIVAIYSRVKYEEKKIIEYLSDSPRPTINLVCDLRCTPPTYGDFSAFLLTFRILNSKFRTNFFLLTDNFSSEWNALDEESAIRSVEDFKAMAFSVTGKSNKEINEKNSFDQLSMDSCDGHTVFTDFVNRRKKIYWDLKYLNILLYKSLGCDSSVLFDKTDHFSTTRDLPKSYVAWHIHGRQNFGPSTLRSFEDGYRYLRSTIGLDIPVIVMSSNQKLSEFLNFANKKKLNVESARLFSSSVLGDIDIVNGADLFFQISGGGLAEFALYSEKPFCLVDYPDKRVKRWNSNHLGLRPFHRKFLPWQNHNQVFISLKTILKS